MEEMRLVLANELRGVPCLCDGHDPSYFTRRADIPNVAISQRTRLAGVGSSSLNRVAHGALGGSDHTFRRLADAVNSGVTTARCLEIKRCKRWRGIPNRKNRESSDE